MIQAQAKATTTHCRCQTMLKRWGSVRHRSFKLHEIISMVQSFFRQRCTAIVTLCAFVILITKHFCIIGLCFFLFCGWIFACLQIVYIHIPLRESEWFSKRKNWCGSKTRPIIAHRHAYIFVECGLICAPKKMVEDEIATKYNIETTASNHLYYAFVWFAIRTKLNENLAHKWNDEVKRIIIDCSL